MRRRSAVSGAAVAGSPAIVTTPPVGTRSRFTSFSVVVFPAPLRPRRTSVSPAPTEKEIPSIKARPFPGSRYRKSFTSSAMATERLIYLCCSSMTQPGAPQPLGMGDFFALEAGEYLDRLDALLQPAAPPAADELVRLARALRGSALMASQQGIARAAMGLEALQPLRGLAALNDLPPLPDLLDGIEQAIGELSRTSGAPPAGVGETVAELFQMAATSIAHAAREVAERGRPDPESAEFRKFAGLLVAFMESEPDVVAIETVGTIVHRGTPPGGESARPATLGRLELVSHGEHLRQAADSLERASSATQRELRAHTLAGTFRALGSAGGGPVAERVAEFAQAAREAVTSGIAVNQPALFAAELRKAGEILTASGTGDEAALAAALAAVTLAVRHLGGAEPPAAAPAPAPQRAQPQRPKPPLPAAPPTTPADRARVSGATRAPSLATEASPDLAGTWTRYQQMVAAGIGPASLEVLISGGSSRVSADPGAAPRGNGNEAVDIRTLLYKGAGARQRAQELREAAKRASGESLRAIIDEVCDLVVLAIEPE